MGAHTFQLQGGDGSKSDITQVTERAAHVRLVGSSVSVTTPIPVQVVQMLDKLSASTDGAPIVIAAATSPGTILHTVPQGEKHLVYLSVSNITTTGRTLTVQWGGTTTAFEMDYEIPANGITTVALGDLVDANTAAFTIRAYVVGGANSCNARGKVEKL